MRKVFLSVYDCKPGMKMAETVFNNFGAVVVAENTIMDLHLIKKMINLGIEKIKIYDQSDNIIIANDSELFKSQYKENIEIVKNVLHDISMGRSIDLKTVSQVSDTIVARIDENRDIISCINQIGNADEYTYTHSINVSLLCMLIGKWMKYDGKKIKQIVQAGLLHDIGKASISPLILNKPDILTSEEFDEIKKHPVHGYRILEKMPGVPESVRIGVLMHHEREDGSGYPMGIRGGMIHDFAKIIAVADIYDAMTSNRKYREKDSPFEVFEMMENRAFGLLDPRVLSAFLTNISAYYIGDFVRLSTGDIGEIVYINSRHISQPVVKVRDEFIDLSSHLEIKIIELI